MSKDDKLGLYAPQIPPERELKREMEEAIAEQRGTYRHTRKGESHICSCTCGQLIVTSLSWRAGLFMDDHRDCPD